MVIYVPGTGETDQKKQNMSLQQLGGGLTTAAANVATNAADIATANTNIAANTTAIATNTTAIATNTTDIAGNTSSISAMQAAWTAYTPAISAQTGTLTTASATGAYLKTGKTVFVRMSLIITTAGTGNNGLVTSLPVAPKGQAAFVGRESAVSGKAIVGSSNASTTLVFNNYDGTSPIASGANCVVNCVYEVS